MPTIVVVDLANVTVDGVPSGSVTDVLTNFKSVAGIRGDVLAALQAWAADRERAHAEALRAREAAHAEALDSLRAKADEQAALIDALGGTEKGREMAREARRQVLLEARARAEAELAEIEGSGT